jgi:hypothetical protein
MEKQIAARFGQNEAITLVRYQPFNGAFSH